LFFERVTRNAFGLESAQRADYAWEGVWQTTVLVLPTVVVLLLSRRGRLADICLVLLVVGLGLSTVALIMVIDDLRHGVDDVSLYRQAAASIAATVWFSGASVVAFFRHVRKRVTGP
jgi:hypothetical protein